MVSSESLKMIGYQNERVPNLFFRQAQETRHLALVFPGRAYTQQMPLLYYPIRMLLARGCDVLCVDYSSSQRPNLAKLQDQELDRWLRADTLAAATAALDQRDYTRLTLLGKSLGTLAMGHVLASGPPTAHLDCVWLTPLLKSPALPRQIQQVPHRALFVSGTADPAYDPARLAEARAATPGSEALLLEGADHGLEFGQDVLRAAQALQTVLAALQKFLEPA